MEWLKREAGRRYFAPRPHSARPGAELGQSVVLVAMVLFVMLAMAGLILDGGAAYWQRRRAQNAADAAASAAAEKLAQGASDSQMYAAANEYAVTRNGATSFTASYVAGGETVGGGSVPSNATGVKVTARITFVTFLLGLLGQPRGMVAGTASAAFGPVSGPGDNLQPLAKFCDQPSLQACGYIPGQSYDIWEGGGPGNFGWLAWNGNHSAPFLELELTPGNHIDYIDPHGLCSRMLIGCWVQGDTGVNDASGVRYQLDGWLERGQAGRPMVIAIYDQSELSGSNVNYDLAGFAAFILESYDLSDKQITGRFVEWLAAAPVDPHARDFGVYSVHLIPP